MSFFKSKEFALILFSSFLFAFAFPPSPFSFLGYLALVPLLFLLEGISARKAFWFCYIFGVITNVLLLYWIIWQTFYGEYFVLPGSIAAFLILAVYPAGWGWLLAHLRLKWNKAVILAPFLWVGMEYLRGMGQIGFPWLDLGYTQTNYLPLIQFAPLTGISGVSFWVVTLNVLAYFLLRNFRNRKRALAYAFFIVILLLGPYLYGERELTSENKSDGIRVALIQGNIDPRTKWDPQFLDYNFWVYDSLSRLAGEAKPDLIIWPETACPCYLEKEPEYLSRVENLAKELNSDLVAGTDDYMILGPQQYVFYNSAFWISPDSGLKKKYNKTQLVPFAERIPYSGNMRLFEEIKLGQANFSPGRELTLFRTPKGSFATLICYEMAFPDLVRRFVKSGADFLVNITNDGWFGRTAGPYQHAAMSIMRAVENRISVARCANTGISLTVDPYGRVLGRTRLFETANLIRVVSTKTETTFFTMTGPWLGKLCLAVTLLAGFLILVRKLF
ncbi:MAG: apolipoprotein N-acyltransferase [candidate division Zixibacteria bacterium RBG_16_48_11]|nr:MAG: apolipoprotein N-acyltransferase [candidate division Zixibacteria bacterium RBG_16_48_11]